MLKDGFAGCTPAVRHCRGRQRFPVGADSISARGGSRRRALSSGRGPGMPGPYRVAIVPGGMTFLRTSATAGKFAVRHCRGVASQTPRGGVRAPRPTYKPQKGRQRFPVAVMLRFFALRTKKSPTVRSRERWGQNAISRPLKRRRAKRQNGGAACYWQEPHRRGKQPVDGSRLVMVSRR